MFTLTRATRFAITRNNLIKTTAIKSGGGGRVFNKDWSQKITAHERATIPAETLAEIESSPFNTRFNMTTEYGKLGAAKAMIALYALIGLFIYLKPKKENPNKPAVKKVNNIKDSNPGNIMAASFDEDYFYSLKPKEQEALLRICNSGIENPDSEMGCYAMNPTDYDKYYAFFKPALEKYHKVDLSARKHINDWNLQGVPGLPANGKLDVSKFGLEPLSMRIRTARNLRKFPLAGAMTKQDRINMELALKPVFDTLIKDPAFGGEYVSLTPGHPNKISDARYQELVKAHIMFKNMADDSFLVTAGIAGDWPCGRGCYISADKGFIIWVGEEDHMRIMAMKKSAVINDVFDRLKASIDKVEELVPGGCAKSSEFGVVTSCPTNMGTGMRASVHLKLPNLTADGTDAKAKAICKPFGLGVRGLGGEHTPIGADGTVDISPKGRFCISEAEIACALYKGVEKVWAEEQKAKK